jgi:hypothetical protein
MRGAFLLRLLAKGNKRLGPNKTWKTRASLKTLIGTLGPLVWQKAPSVDFLRHFVRENKANFRKKNDK